MKMNSVMWRINGVEVARMTQAITRSRSWTHLWRPIRLMVGERIKDRLFRYLRGP